jgi:UDP-glucuronate decarboxylase
MKDLAKKVGIILNKEIEYNIIEYPDSYPADEPNRRCPNVDKAKIQLGFEAKVALDDGLTRFLTWAQENYV